MNVKPPSSKSVFPARARIKLGTQRLGLAWLVLALYLGFYSPLGMGIASVLGSFDSAHELCVRSGDRGLALVMHHGQACAGHHHGVVAKALTLLAQPATSNDPDHVIQFGTATSLSTKTQLAVPHVADSELIIVPLDHISIASLQPVLAEPERHHPLTAESGTMLCLRTTLLLI